MKILFAEDETDLRDVVSAYLEFQGYFVDAVGNGREALARACSDAYDTIIMDIMMPEMDGITAMRRIRDTGNTTPALFLTAKGEVSDRVTGLDAGADDYLTKPFAMEELSARLRALGRRKREYSVRTLTFGNLELDTEASEIRAQNTISLSHKEVRLLSCLMTNTGRDMISDPGIGHSDIRGFGLLLTDRSMVRRERHRLKAWITVACANIETSWIVRTLIRP